MKLNKNICLLLLLFICFLKPKAQSKELLVGDWSFVTFEVNNETPKELTATLQDAIDENQGLKYSFSANGKVKVALKGGPAVSNFEGVYRYYPEKKNLIIDSGEFMFGTTIILLNNTTLKLYNRKQKVTLVLKKVTN